MRSTAKQDRLNAALDERGKLTTAYRVAKRVQLHRAYDTEPRLRWFAAEIRSCGTDDAKRLIAVVQAQHEEWLRHADHDTRALALEIVATRIRQIREIAGLVPFDDPLPEEPDDVFQICKRVLS